MTASLEIDVKVEELTKANHDRNVIGYRYVYPVVSRRAGGVSIGINLNYNNACNWRCVYCQVPDLKRGSAPILDLMNLETELRSFTNELICGDFLDRHVPETSRVLKDFAISGNGEPTSSPQFTEAIEIIGRIRASHPRLETLPIVLITNGSLADRKPVQTAMARLAELGGNIWFKLDRGSDDGLRRTNNITTHVARHISRLETVARVCPTWVQSCWFRRDGSDPSLVETEAFLDVIAQLNARNVPIRGVQLYTLARQPLQPEADTLEAVSVNWLRQLGEAIELRGFPVTIAP
jgi:wyosine [tRNA(Phe)-imidazoG37] synthetase (radical SAM superfamily)